MQGNFSVLMPVYIKEKPEYFDRALKSVLEEQLLKPAEVVIVEDGPITIELKNIIDKYKRDYPNIIKSVILNENKGLGNALNIGLKATSFDIVARMDADDISLPERFERQYSFFLANKYDVVGTNILEFETNEYNIVGQKKVPENHSDILKYAKFRSPINHPTVMFNKKAVLESGSYEKMPGFEDYYLWVKMLKKGYQFYNIQEPLLKFRTGKETIKRRGGLEYFKNEKALFKKFVEIEFLNYFQYLLSLSMRFPVRIAPKNFRMFFYKKFLRDKNN